MSRNRSRFHIGSTTIRLVVMAWLFMAFAACWPFFLGDPSPSEPPEDTATPDVQSTIDAAVRVASMRTHGPAPKPTADVQSTMESLSPTIDAMVRALAVSTTPTPALPPTPAVRIEPTVPAQPSPVATLPFSPIIPHPTPITPTLEAASTVKGDNSRPFAPMFSTPTLDGSQFSLGAESYGTPTLVVIWAPW